MRRRAMLALAVQAALSACEKRRDGRCHEAPPGLRGHWEELSFSPSAIYDQAELATVLVEPAAPVLVALHGRGEAGRGLEAGARGWRDDYQLDRAQARCHAPPLTADDFHGFVKADRLAALNASLAAAPYRGVSVACPYAPALFDRSLAGAAPYGRFIVEALLPRVRAAAEGAQVGRAATGIDGVSMGGRLALLVGLSHPETFGVVGALQPAIGEQEVPWLVALAAEAKPRPKIRLVSSEGDPFLGAVRALSKALAEASVDHGFVVTPGPHDYVWNEGPGCYEMLLWHERVLRGLPAP